MNYKHIITTLLLTSTLALIACAGGGGGGSGSGGPANINNPEDVSEVPSYAIRAENYDANGNLSGYDVRLYNAADLLLSIENYDANGTRMGYENYTYNAAKELTRKDSYTTDGVPLGYDSYTYMQNATTHVTIIASYVYVTTDGVAVARLSSVRRYSIPLQDNPARDLILTGYIREYRVNGTLVSREIYNATNHLVDSCKYFSFSETENDITTRTDETICDSGTEVSIYENGQLKSTSYKNADGTPTGHVLYFRDQDNDGIRDDDDNCLATPNPVQGNIDGDDKGDLCDPDTINTETEFQMFLRDNSHDTYNLARDLTIDAWSRFDFNGTLNGHNHTITFNSGGTLFQTINSGATVTNIGILGGTLAVANYGSITNTYATGDNRCYGWYCRSGGLVDYNYPGGTITNSYATGTSSCSADPTDPCYSGGLVGENRGTITASYATGDISCSTDSCNSGGLVGRNDGTISDSYAIGNSQGRFSGGLVGYHRYHFLTRPGSITNSFATGSSTCPGTNCNRGGLVGHRAPDRGVGATVTNSYRVQNVGTDGGDGDIHRTLAQLRCPTGPDQTCQGATDNTYTDWDSTIWDFGDQDALPTIKNLLACPTTYPYCRHYSTKADQDSDGIVDATDNCRTIPNRDQTNTDRTADGGDACDNDDDNDRILDTADNCRLVSNPQQYNNDTDARGDACDDDDDNDRILDTADNCRIVANRDQANNHGTSAGDACEDTDGDGRLDSTDNCPTIPNPDQANAISSTDDEGDACDDSDRDGIYDITDNCPHIANPTQANMYGDLSNRNGSGDACEDTDGDGYHANGTLLVDAIDNCPTIKNRDQNNTDGAQDGGDACDDDDDNDRILDTADNCPHVANPDQANNHGTSAGDACEDTDGDGHLDSTDNCPHVANRDQNNIVTPGDAEGDACDDPDADDIVDVNDNCPIDYNPTQIDLDNDTVGDLCDPGTTIADADALQAITNGVYRLTANLTVIRDWTPIADFSGTLNGDHHIIRGLSAALFDTIEAGATVTNLGILGSTLALINHGKISHTYATGNSTCTGAQCSSGGLVSYNTGTITNSYATGDSACASTSCRSGGLVGSNSITGTIAYAYATGKSRGIFRGGLVGHNAGSITSSYAIGDNQGSLRGGLVGFNDPRSGRITNSYRVQQAGVFVRSGSIQRNLTQLRCPIAPGQTCQGVGPTYNGWSNHFWNFGTKEDLPTLNELPPCPLDQPQCRHYRQGIDRDNDGTPDLTDNCPLTSNRDQYNNDSDPFGDACDTDDDDDTIPDYYTNGTVRDNCRIVANRDQTDLNGDGIGDACDTDDDNDGHLNTADNCPTIPNPDQNNTDGANDGGDACDDDDDNDRILDTADNCPTIPNHDQANLDNASGDMRGDACDDDDDNDGRPDTADNCPTVPNRDQANLDNASGDMRGDVCDPDLDGDGYNNTLPYTTVLNAHDNCPTIPNPDQNNTDRDDTGDVCDPDLDGDGYNNTLPYTTVLNAHDNCRIVL